MNIRLVFLLLGIIAFSGCGESEECKKLALEATELKEVATAKTKELEIITNSLNEVEANLASIQLAEQQIDSLNAAANGKPNANQKERIDNRITAIKNYLENNRLAIERLEAQLRKAQNQDKVKGLQNMVARMREQMEEKESEISGLRTAVDSLRSRVSDLDSSLNFTANELSKNEKLLSDREKDIAAKEAMLNTAYIYVGDKKDLETNGIIKREGGVFGLGKKSSLNDKLETAKFKKISVKEITELDLGNVKKTEFLTKHPTDSYTLLMVEKKVVLRITNVDKFWSLSKYLVIEIQ